MKRTYDVAANMWAGVSLQTLSRAFQAGEGKKRVQSVVSLSMKVWAVGFLLLAWTNAVCAANLGRKIVKMTGARTKLVWVRSAPDKNSEATKNPTYTLIGFDTQENKERILLSGLLQNVYPWITYDGSRVIVPDPSKKVSYVMDWDGKNKKVLAQGKLAEALCYWRDPKTGTEWVYMANAVKGPKNLGPVYRVQLDKPTVKELVWNKTKVTKFRVSGDGTQAVALFPHPKVGVALLPNISWKQYAKGCAIDIAPDTSGRFLHMAGRHREAYIYDKGGRNKRKVDMSHAPGMGGSEIWGPRWSNDVQYFVVSGPYPLGLASGRFDPGNIYLGIFNKDLTKVDEWIQVTNQRDAKDICAYAWIEKKAVPEVGAKLTDKLDAPLLESLINQLGKARSTSSIIRKIEEISKSKEDPLKAGQASNVIKHIEDWCTLRLKSLGELEKSDPYQASKDYRSFATRFKGTPWASEASKRQKAPKFKKELMAWKKFKVALSAEKRLKEVKGVASSASVPKWLKKNQYAIKSIQKIARELDKKHPGTAAQKKVHELIEKYDLPTDAD